MSAKLGVKKGLKSWTNIDNSPISISQRIVSAVNKTKRKGTRRPTVGRFKHEIRRIYKYADVVDKQPLLLKANECLTLKEFEELNTYLLDINIQMRHQDLRENYEILRTTKRKLEQTLEFITDYEIAQSRYDSLQRIKNRDEVQEDNASRLHTLLLNDRQEYLSLKKEVSKLQQIIINEKQRLNLK